MNQTEQEIIEETKNYVQQTLDNDGSHDWWHVYRVWNVATHIAQSEPEANLFVVELAALLHDIDDWKFHGDKIYNKKNRVTEWLDHLGLDQETKDHVSHIITAASFKGAKSSKETLSIEGQIVQDADRLDAMGAIGIARAFAYGGFKNREIHNPHIDPKMHLSFEEYKSNNSTTINHFHEKLLLLKDQMNTKIAKEIAQKRHDLMLEYLEHFSKEWNMESIQ